MLTKSLNSLDFLLLAGRGLSGLHRVLWTCWMTVSSSLTILTVSGANKSRAIWMDQEFVLCYVWMSVRTRNNNIYIFMVAICGMQCIHVPCMTASEWLPTSRLSGSRLSVHHLHVKRFSSAPQRLIQHLPIVSRNVYHQQNVWTTAVTAGRFAISPPVTPLLPRSQSRGDNRDYAAAVVYWCGKARVFD